MKRESSYAACQASLVAAASIALLTGCATPPAPIPSAYFAPKHEISVNVTHIPDRAVLMDSGQGGLLGSVVSSALRSGNLEKQMEGIKSDTVKELLRQQISSGLEQSLNVVDESKQLSMEVNILNWGWFVPTAALGIRTGAYQLQVNGNVSIYDQQQNRTRVSYFTALSSQSLGNDPTAETTQKALVDCVNDFSTKVVNYVLQKAPAQN